ncbi:phosphoribosylglycinamide formyltransferase [Helicobacter pametensis]|uniref:phosphoribosylglycinamide formyltransferase n=1 Tax=Helicobacter pametensis TaxID=95149 RepID=UPI000486F66C|nr:phosphoribosylglycinamide formyltransferase [Helicobacter pametensis]
MLNIAVFASGNGSNLEVLLNTQFNQGKIALVLSNNPSAYALQRAKNHNIAHICINKKEVGEKFESEILKAMQKHHIDCIVLAGFMLILSADFISHFPNKIINIHPSLIPAFCGDGFYGMRVHEAVLEYGAKVSGASVHFVNEIVDGGKIIAQEAINLSEDETPQSLQTKVAQVEHRILPQAVQFLIDSILTKEQHETLH